MGSGTARAACYRVAAVWENDSLRGQRILSGLYRWAHAVPGLTLFRFDARHPRFEALVIEEIRRMRPHGMVSQCGNLARMAQLRRRFPRIPIVATNPLPPEVATTTVAGSTVEMVRLARDHFRSRGVQAVALFCSSADNPHATALISDLFRSEVPEGRILAQQVDDQHLSASRRRQQEQRLARWLRGLPKPVGLVTLETHAALHLARICRRAGLRVPRDIQIVGVDDVDDCMACTPHLSSLDLPSERIGEVALATLVQHMSGALPRPPAIIRVEGGTIMARGSTGRVPRGDDEVATALHLIQADAVKGITPARIVRLARKSSTSTFYRTFRASTGTTLSRLLARARLEEASRLLRETTSSITAISESCGFASANYFAQVFRRAMGESPSNFRMKRAARAAGTQSLVRRGTVPRARARAARPS